VLVEVGAPVVLLLLGLSVERARERLVLLRVGGLLLLLLLVVPSGLLGGKGLSPRRDLLRLSRLLRRGEGAMKGR